ncbi:hypothetical protein [Luteolibacter sp. Populi]|uniref:hypothetical protein n=1 Tax=Luteolibacter sp. Populi TaxID=3230487 RepID=UPI0034663C69
MSKPTWTAIRKSLKGWEPAALLALIKDLHDASPNNRHFLLARVGAVEGGGEAFESFRKRVVEPFYPARGEPKLKLGEARKAIREYHKATGNTAGTIELLLAYIETGTAFTCDFGDIDARFYDGLCSAIDELAERVKREGLAMWETVSPRFGALVIKTNGIGWGYHDHLRYTCGELEEHFPA